MSGLILIAFALFTSGGLPFPPTAATNNTLQEHATIQRRRTVLVRSAEVARLFPRRRTAIIIYPVISGLKRSVLNKVRAHLSFKNIFDYSLAEYRNDAWLSQFSYVVNHNADSLLDITFTQSGVAAYPDEQSRHFLIDLRSGKLVTAADAFQPETLTLLTAKVEAELQREIAKLRKDNAGSTDRDPEQKTSVNDAYDTLEIDLKDLDNFSVSRRGITFLYDEELHFFTMPGFLTLLRHWNLAVAISLITIDLSPTSEATDRWVNSSAKLECNT
jgi:hypothetical protein